MKNAKVTLDLLLNDSDFSKQLDSSIKGAGQLATGMAALSVGVGILGSIGSKAIELGLSFEETNAKVSTLFGDVQVDTKNLESKILDLSTTTGIAATELNEGLYSALSAGIPVTEDMGEATDFLNKATMLAVAGFTDVEKAVDVSTTVLNAYGLGVEETDRVMNTLIETQNAGKTTVDELASSLGKAIPTASSLGINFEELSASMAILTANGINTAEATTAVSALFKEMNDNGSDVNKMFQELNGTNIADFLKNGGSMEEVLGILNDGLTDQDKKWGDILSSSEAVTAAQTLMKDGGEDLSEVYQRLTDDTSEMAAAYEKMETPQKKLNEIQQGINKAFIELGAVILEKVEPALTWVSDNINIIAPIMLGLATAVGIVAVVFGIASVAAGILALGLVPLIAGFITAAAPIVAIIAFAAGLVVAFIEAAKETETLQLVMDIFGKTFQIIFLLIGSVLKLFWAGFKLVFTAVKEISKDFLEEFKPQMEAINKALDKVIKFLKNVFEGNWDEVFASIKRIAQKMINWFSETFPTVSKIAGKVVDTVKGIMAKDWSAAWDKFKSAASKGMDWFKGKFPATSSVISDTIDTVKALMTGKWQLAWNTFKNIPINAINAMIGGIQRGLNSVLSAINGFASKVAGVVNKIPGVSFNAPSIGSLNLPKVPKFAKGGIVNGAGFGIIGEAGPEMILPLNKNGAQFLQTALGGMDIKKGSGDQVINFEMIVDGDMVASNPNELRANILSDIDNFLGGSLQGMKGAR